MNEKRSAIFTIAVLASILLVFTVADLIKDDRLFSETENRILAVKPKFSLEAMFQGKYMKDYETYVTDQFVSRDKWIAIKTYTDLALGRKEINGVYLGKDGYLIEPHLPEDYPKELEEEKTALLKRLVERWDAQVMLVPTADNILVDKMPSHAPYYDQTAMLNRMREQIGDRNWVDVCSILKEHAKEEIYYRTDHHWTSLGAYYGYLGWAKAQETVGAGAALGGKNAQGGAGQQKGQKEDGKQAGKESAQGEAVNEATGRYGRDGLATAAEGFLGTLHSKVNVDVKADVLQYFPETLDRPLKVTYDMRKSANSCYEESYLDTKNKYGFFLDDNHALVEIETDYHNGKTLFVIKDSYANCFVPLLIPHYERIYVMDLRYFNGRLFSFMEERETEAGMDVLVLYNCIHFLEEFKYLE